jgi:D-sedoheptulose 7-phosphate isomerase
MQEFVSAYMKETAIIAESLDVEQLTSLIESLKNLKQNRGRLFFAGIGGSSANASHAVNDFRKIGGIETHSLTENVAELTARINDDGWDNSFVDTLKTFNPTANDVLFVLSVGGGSATTSQNLVKVMDFSRSLGMKIFSIVSRDGGHAKKVSNICVLVPVLSTERITPHAEGFQAVIWHCLVNGVCK